jgi:hypothetical protein
MKKIKTLKERYSRIILENSEKKENYDQMVKRYEEETQKLKKVLIGVFGNGTKTGALITQAFHNNEELLRHPSRWVRAYRKSVKGIARFVGQVRKIAAGAVGGGSLFTGSKLADVGFFDDVNIVVFYTSLAFLSGCFAGLVWVGGEAWGNQNPIVKLYIYSKGLHGALVQVANSMQNTMNSSFFQQNNVLNLTIKEIFDKWKDWTPPPGEEKTSPSNIEDTFKLLRTEMRSIPHVDDIPVEDLQNDLYNIPFIRIYRYFQAEAANQQTIDNIKNFIEEAKTTPEELERKLKSFVGEGGNKPDLHDDIWDTIVSRLSKGKRKTFNNSNERNEWLKTNFEISEPEKLDDLLKFLNSKDQIRV